MLSYQDALDIILSGGYPLAAQVLGLRNAVGYTAARPIYAPEDLPAFDNSAMDGFAVKSNAAQGAHGNNPIVLTVVGSTMAGDHSDDTAKFGDQTAWEIMTGAPVPKGYDAVIRIEDITILEKDAQGKPYKIGVLVDGFAGKNIRRAGSDFCPKDIVIEKGTTIGPHHVMALAALGQDQITVTSKPKVAVISTGKELVDDCSQALKSGQIRNSNGPYLLSSLKAFGLDAAYEGTIFDDEQKFEQKIADLLLKDYQIIISSGAVSMGRHDFIPQSLVKMGAKILFHKVAIRPGKPILFARLPNGSYYFGLPGNPIAAAVGLRFFVYPLIQKLEGKTQERPIAAILDNDFSKESPFRFFQKAVCRHDEKGCLRVEILSGQQSFKIKPMLSQNCWVAIPEDGLCIGAGQRVDVYPLYGDIKGSALL